MSTITRPRKKKVAKRTPKEIEALIERITEKGKGEGSVTFMSRTRGPVKLSGYKDITGSRVAFADRHSRNSRGVTANVFLADGVTPAGAIEFRQRNFTTSKRNVALIRALLCHPECEGSPNGGGLVTFQLQDPEGEKRLAREARSQELAARNIAVNLRGVEQVLAAAHFRVLAADADTRAEKLDVVAESDPVAFASAFAGGEKKIALKDEYRHSAIAAAATSKIFGVITKSEGAPYTFEGVSLGSTYNTLIESLEKDPAIADRVYSALEKIK